MRSISAVLSAAVFMTALCCGCGGDTTKPATQPPTATSSTQSASGQSMPPVIRSTPDVSIPSDDPAVPKSKESPKESTPTETVPVKDDAAEKLAEIENLQKVRPVSMAQLQSTQEKILDLSVSIIAADPEPAQRDQARLAALQAMSLLTRVDSKRYDLLERLDKLADEMLAETPEGSAAASAHYYRTMVHLNVERDGSEHDPSVNKRLFAMAKQFAEKFATDQRAGELLYGIGQNAQMDGQNDTAKEILQFIAEHEPNSPYGQLAAGQLKLLDAIGKPPEIVGPTLDGSEFDIASLKGKVVLVDFWATWCGPCVQELPHVKEVYEKYHDQGFEVVAVSFDETKDELVQFVEKEKLPWPQIFFDEDGKRSWQNPLGRKYSINAIPATFLVDREGNLQKIGVRGSALEPAVTELLRGAKSPEAN